jgi:hypothetical protein
VEVDSGRVSVGRLGGRVRVAIVSVGGRVRVAIVSVGGRVEVGVNSVGGRFSVNAVRGRVVVGGRAHGVDGDEEKA